MRFVNALLCCLLVFATSAAAQKNAQPREITEDFRFHAGFKSKYVPKPRQIIVHLPRGYAREEARRYPVLYMLDGPSVFATWRIDETARALAEAGHITPLIIVGVPHGGSQQLRTDEYTPTHMLGQGGGKGDALGRMLSEELKPFIDSQYRTLADAEHTGLGGVSFGGLVSLHIGLKHPETFGRLAVMSPSVWWDDAIILRSVRSLKARPATRIWLDVGTAEGREMWHNAKRLRDALVNKGWTLDNNLAYFEDAGAEHVDAAWARRAEHVLKFLFPARAGAQPPTGQ
ncbi:MAG TPA: alpha/beta hydrolase-fold protein [Pyrinomonadaceae bacterium]|nr:alpha/beta hydrolase-fold protein [Pyrinomonadaceae bacterium]